MKFQTLRLSGFKSFVEQTEMTLAPGLTGVVGPNGCGKSNVLEAMRWVMGESSAKSMRGDGMEDVIFAGAATRPPKNFAEVSLLIDNAEGRAPSPFTAEPTLEVVRRITRNAGSAYRVNGKEVRARDVRVLFADAATGAQSPSLVRQGQIGVLIASKPQGRRRILEDAAGVSGLYERRREVEQRLRAADENLARIDDVLSRLDSQIGGLRRQARHAERYGALTEEIRGAAAELVWRRYRKADESAQEARAALDAAVRTVSATTAAASQAERARDEAQAALPKLREEEGIARALHQRLLSRRDVLEAEAARVADNLARLERDAAQVAGDLEREADLSGDAALALDALAGETETLRAAALDAAALSEAEGAAQAAEAAVLEAEQVRDGLAERAAAGRAAREAAERALREAETLAKGATSRLEAAVARRDALTKALEKADAAAISALAEAEKTGAALARLPERLAEAETARARLDGEGVEARTALGAAKTRAGSLEAEATTLRRAIEADDRETPRDAVLNRVKVAPGYEKALAAALSDEAGAGELASFDARGRGWRALGAMDLPDGPGDSLAANVDAPEVLTRRLEATRLVARGEGDALQARLAPGQSLVSAEGDLWRWDGFVAGGDIGAAEALAARLQRRNRMAALDAELAQAREAREALAAQLETLDKRRNVAQSEEVAARAELKAAEDAAARTSRLAADAEAERDRAARALAAEADDLARLRGEAEAATQRADENRTALTQIADPAALVTAAEEARTALTKARETRDRKRAAHNGLMAQERRRGERLAAIAREEKNWRDRATTAGARREDLDRRLALIEKQRDEARAAPAKVATERESLEEKAREIETRLSGGLDALAAAESGAAQATSQASETARALAAAREALARAEAIEETAAGRADEAKAALVEETGGELKALADRFADLPPARIEDIEARLLRARADRERLGAVNLRAAIEIKEAETERDTLGTEKADLEAAIAKLRAGLAALNREGRTRLLAAFEQVNGHFSTLFKHLFGGGEASLQLTESDDPLEAGLEIICHPPGKRTQTLSLLSGGEQTLTALALIFAVFLVNAAPVCVLDEVDAPLDDANVGRFCDLLDEMTRRTESRFLVITHHALTMSRMDRLFGVTMIERGVSRLVSVDLGAAVELVETSVPV